MVRPRAGVRYRTRNVASPRSNAPFVRKSATWRCLNRRKFKQEAVVVRLQEPAETLSNRRQFAPIAEGFRIPSLVVAPEPGAAPPRRRQGSPRACGSRSSERAREGGLRFPIRILRGVNSDFQFEERLTDAMMPLLSAGSARWNS